MKDTVRLSKSSLNSLLNRLVLVDGSVRRFSARTRPRLFPFSACATNLATPVPWQKRQQSRSREVGRTSPRSKEVDSSVKVKPL